MPAPGTGSPYANWRDLVISRLPIRTKLAALLLAPMLALIAVTGVLVHERLDAASHAATVRRVVDVASEVAPVVDQLQAERSLVGARLLSKDDIGLGDRWKIQAAVTDRAVAKFSARARALEAQVGGTWVSDEIGSALAQTRALADARAAVAAGSADSLTAQAAYTSVIDRLLGVSERIAARARDASLAPRASASLSLARVKEDTAKQAGILAGAFTAGRVPDDAFAAGVAARASEAVHTAEFRRTAPEADLARFDALGHDAAVSAADALRDDALVAPGQALDADPAVWRSVMAAKRSKLSDLEGSLRSAVVAAASSSEASSRRDALSVAAVSIALLVLTVLLAIAIARSVIRPVRRLTGAAGDVARDLPAIVAAIAAGGAVPEPEALDVRGGEMGALADAFTEVRRVAVDVAGEQAALRAGIGDMFVNLARRNQALLERQLAFIDALEKEERDPDVLEDLFRLDHLSTCMRRNAESLLILGGAEPARRWRNAVLLRDVIRAAASEVEDYQRVRVPDLDLLSVSGPVAAGLVHLLAELLENGCRFSSPETPVDVRVNQLDGVFTVTVHDRGIGMSDEALAAANAKLATPPLVDATVSRQLGLLVVGRLAARLGVAVRLGRSAWGGVAAQVVVPASLVSVAAPERPADPHPPAPPSGGPGSAAAGARSPLGSSPPPGLSHAVAPAPSEASPATRLAPPGAPGGETQLGPEAAAAPVAGVAERTASGLARRVPRGAPAPQPPLEPIGPGGPPAATPSPTAAPGLGLAAPGAPDRIQSALSRFQAGLERGRAEASEAASEAAPEAASEAAPAAASAAASEAPGRHGVRDGDRSEGGDHAVS